MKIIIGSISQHAVAISALKLDFFQTRLLDGFRASLLCIEAEEFPFFILKRFRLQISTPPPNPSGYL
jgi:hypothetical protein